MDGAIDAVDKLIRAENQVLGAKSGTLRREQRMLRGVLQAVADGNDLAQHAVELGAQLLDGGKAALRIRVGGALQQAVERQEAAQLRLLGRGGDAGQVDAVLGGQLEAERSQGAADGVDIAGDGRALGGHFRGLVALGAVDIAKRANAGDRA